ncbi:efflux RND transporter periplasmic adaptor subunit [Maribacter dokdonensis]|uniref:efflux RND transporter periplasmic adaptor subunit n=1 Tax=Maribacter dokdonensis TaxID=320912 RepID=UPI0027347AA1|nr:efflux RND transporter periplasmic adaptor subunit [Maribacter dokdonensis]MDP2526511.1 efflux RND transporter periplasmic adaptor subunit [Maribacter dokdonensis]|tara:strand:+ start:3175 stop:4341 length:1167 start_codon:yes stop_codon:yes gene_type:complete
MKKLPILLIAVISLYSCGGEDQSVAEIISGQNLEAIRAKKNEITTQQKLIDAQLKSLDSAIAILGNEEKLPLVNTLTAKKEIFNHYLELQGDVSTKQNVLIYPEMAGTLQRVYVKEGDRVSKGQVLATIDDGGMSSQLNQLKTQASLAKTTFERQERLWNQNIGSEIQYLQAKTNYEAAENMVSQAQSQLGKSTIRAPFSGIIDNVIKDQGTVVAPGQGSEVFRIVNLSDMYIEVEVPEAYLGNVTKGKEALVYFPILGDSVVTKIRETGNFINPSNRSFEAEIPVPNKEGKIKPNLSAKVNINDYTSEDAILIPTSIISENADGEQYVFVADEPNADGESVVKRTIITTGKTQGAAIEVLTGLNDGDHIIKEGARSVKDGQKVKIKK